MRPARGAVDSPGSHASRSAQGRTTASPLMVPSPWRHRLSRVRVRVTLAATAVSIVGAVLGAVLFVLALRENLNQALLDSAQQQAASVAAQLESGTSPSEAVVSGRHDVLIQVVDASGVLLATDHPSVTTPLRTSPGITDSTRIGSLVDTYVVLATRTPDGRLAVAALSTEQVARATQTTVVLLAVVLPIGVALLGMVIWFAVGRALRPVEVMRREADALSSEHLHRRLAVPPGDDEIPMLAATLNRMLDRIDASSRKQRQFVQDASHELRSPLAIVRQIAESARRHPDSVTVARLAADVLVEEQRMEALVTSLLTLARLEEGVPSTNSAVDLDDLVLHEANRLRVSGPALQWDLSRVSAGQVLGDPVLLGQTIHNLMSNAARHAHGTVAVSLEETADQVVLTVDDDGEGIADADRERVFDRFARLDDARARDSGGVGLGLAIVSRVVAATGGSVSVGTAPMGGARFTVTLPRPAGTV